MGVRNHVQNARNPLLVTDHQCGCASESASAACNGEPPVAGSSPSWIGGCPVPGLATLLRRREALCGRLPPLRELRELRRRSFRPGVEERASPVVARKPWCGLASMGDCVRLAVRERRGETGSAMLARVVDCLSGWRGALRIDMDGEMAAATAAAAAGWSQAESSQPRGRRLAARPAIGPGTDRPRRARVGVVAFPHVPWRRSINPL